MLTDERDVAAAHRAAAEQRRSASRAIGRCVRRAVRPIVRQAAQRVRHPDGPQPGEAQPPRVSLQWISPTRLTVIGEHFVNIWSTDGKAVASFVVPR